MAGLVPAIHVFRQSFKDVDARYKAGHDFSELKIHLKDVQPARVPVDGVDNATLVDEHVIELNRAGRGVLRRWRDESGDFLGLIWVGNVVGAQPAVEESADHDLVRLPRRRNRWILVDIVCARSEEHTS